MSFRRRIILVLGVGVVVVVVQMLSIMVCLALSPLPDCPGRGKKWEWHIGTPERVMGSPLSIY